MNNKTKLNCLSFLATVSVFIGLLTLAGEIGIGTCAIVNSVLIFLGVGITFVGITFEGINETRDKGLSQEESRILGNYSDALVKQGAVAAKRFLTKLPMRPSGQLQSLMATVRLLYAQGMRDRLRELGRRCNQLPK